jgi:hypothetical protein
VVDYRRHVDEAMAELTDDVPSHPVLGSWRNLEYNTSSSTRSSC